MVARAGRHDAAGALVRGELHQLVGRPALLERAGPLEVFQLEVDLRAAHLGEDVGAGTRRDLDDAADAIAGGEDISKADHGGGRVTPPRAAVKLFNVAYAVSGAGCRFAGRCKV